MEPDLKPRRGRTILRTPGAMAVSSRALKKAVDRGWRQFWEKRGITPDMAASDFGDISNILSRRRKKRRATQTNPRLGPAFSKLNIPEG